MNVAEYIARFLSENTAGTVFTLSGTGSIHLNSAVALQPGLAYVCARHEATAAIMATALSRVSGLVGVAIVTTGPGAINGLSGATEAWVDSTPLLMISGQVARDQIWPEARTFGVQGVDIVGLAQRVTKYAHLVQEPQSIRFHLEKALHLARSGRPGPVWLDIPFDVQAMPLSDPDDLEGFDPPPPVTVCGLSLDAAVSDALERLRGARRPLIVVGQGVRHAGGTEEFVRLAERLKLPVVATRSVLGILPESHPLSMGLGGVRGRPHNGLVMERADVVLSLGCSLSNGFVGEDWEAFSSEVQIVMVDTDRHQLRKAGHRVVAQVGVDVRAFMHAMLQHLDEDPGQGHAAWMGECNALKLSHPLLPAQYDGGPITSYQLVRCLEQHARANAIFVSDTGGGYYTTGQILSFKPGHRELTSSAFANMGIALPLAIGAAIGAPGSQVICISGDGSLELNIQELRTIVQYRLPICVFVINNGGYGSIRDTQDEHHTKAAYIDDTHVLDFARVAATFGLAYARVAYVQELAPTVCEMLAKNRPVLVEVLCDPRQKIMGPLRTKAERPLAPAASQAANLPPRA